MQAKTIVSLGVIDERVLLTENLEVGHFLDITEGPLLFKKNNKKQLLRLPTAWYLTYLDKIFAIATV